MGEFSAASGFVVVQVSVRFAPKRFGCVVRSSLLGVRKMPFRRLLSLQYLLGVVGVVVRNEPPALTFCRRSLPIVGEIPVELRL
jgi:hypothetical protein